MTPDTRTTIARLAREYGLNPDHLDASLARQEAEWQRSSPIMRLRAETRPRFTVREGAHQVEWYNAEPNGPWRLILAHDHAPALDGVRPRPAPVTPHAQWHSLTPTGWYAYLQHARTNHSRVLVLNPRGEVAWAVESPHACIALTLHPRGERLAWVTGRDGWTAEVLDSRGRVLTEGDAWRQSRLSWRGDDLLVDDEPVQPVLDGDAE